MRSKDILSIIVFVSAFVFSSAFASLFTEVRTGEFHTDTKTSIENLLRQDIRNGRERLWRVNNYRYSSEEANFARYAESVEKYADESGSMSYGHLPRDFQWKWRKHMKAWRNYSNFLNDVKHHPEDLKDEDVYRTRNELIYEINSTWFNVLRVGRKYGSEVSD